MKKTLFTFLILLSIQSIAQKGTNSVSFGLNYGSPLNAKLTNKLGQNVSLHFGVGKKSNINLNYVTFKNKIKFTSDAINNHFVTLGYQHYFGQKKNLFFSSEAGVLLNNAQVLPVASVGAGYSILLNKYSRLEVGTKYYISQNSGSNNNWLLFNVGLKINLGKK